MLVEHIACDPPRDGDGQKRAIKFCADSGQVSIVSKDDFPLKVAYRISMNTKCKGEKNLTDLRPHPICQRRDATSSFA